MGIGDSVTSKIQRGIIAYKSRDKIPRHPVSGHALRTRSNDKWPRVLCFLWLVYHSQAEVLPNRFRMPNGYIREGLIKDEEDGDFSDRYVLAFLHGIASHGKVPHLDSIGPGSFEGPRKYLQHRKAIDLYNEYCAHEVSCSQKPCCLSACMRCFKQISKTHLKFRGQSEHAECNVCSKLKKRMAEGRSDFDKQKVYRIYSAHVLSQWIDRQVYWHQRTLSQDFFRASR